MKPGVREQVVRELSHAGCAVHAEQHTATSVPAPNMASHATHEAAQAAFDFVAS